MARGLDVLELVPSAHLSAKEIATAKLVVLDQFNPQRKPRITWPAAFPIVRSYLDQLVHNNGLASTRTSAIDAALSAAEKQTGGARGSSLRKLAGQVDADVAKAKDGARVRALSAEMKRLAAVSK